MRGCVLIILTLFGDSLYDRKTYFSLGEKSTGAGHEMRQVHIGNINVSNI